MITFLFLAAAAAQPMPAMAMAKAEPTCVTREIVPGFEGWGKAPPAQQLTIGGYALLALAPADAVKFAPPLNRAPAPGSLGGVYALTLKTAGTYRFAMAPGAWIDVISSKSERLPSAAHTHGPACSGIAKIVDYTLEPGDYVVQFSATTAPRLGVMVMAK